MAQFIFFLIFLLLAPLLFAFWVEGVGFLASVLLSATLLWFGAGLGVGLLVWLILSDAIAGFVNTAVHELTHATVGLLFFKRVTYMEAKSDGTGVTQIVQGEHNPFIGLAPYYFPLFTLPFLIAKPFLTGMGGTANHAIDALIGFTLGFHYVMHIKQFRFVQTDLQKVGLVASIGMTYTLMLIFLVVIVAVVLGQYSSILDCATGAFARVPGYYQVVLSWLRELASWLGLITGGAVSPGAA